jgi:thiol-disulfide isomerase/thioredoxin
MKHIFVKIFVVCLVFCASAQHANSQHVRMIKFPELESMMKQESDTTYVFNFWATWCKPCIKELPYFDQLASHFPDRKIRVILVSLDFKRQYETNLKPFLVRNNIQSEVLLLDEPDYNSWIDKVDPGWGGAIPATLVLNNKSGTHKFYEKDFAREDLIETVKSLLP